MRERGHCPKCRACAAKAWLAAQKRGAAVRALFPPGLYVAKAGCSFSGHCLAIACGAMDIAHQSKPAIYNLLMRASADTVIKIAADPKRLGAHRHHLGAAHLEFSVVLEARFWRDEAPPSCAHEGGGLSVDGANWITSRKTFFNPAAFKTWPVPLRKIG